MGDRSCFWVSQDSICMIEENEIKSWQLLAVLVSFKWVLNDGRIRRVFAFFTLSSLTEEVSLAVCSILMVNPVLTNMLTSCKRATDFNCMGGLFHIPYSQISDYCKAVSINLWLREPGHRAAMWCAQHEEKSCFSPTSCRIHWHNLSYGWSMDSACWCWLSGLWSLPDTIAPPVAERESLADFFPGTSCF